MQDLISSEIMEYREEHCEETLEALSMAIEALQERKQQVTEKDIETWLNKWDGYIDKDIIARMCYRICDIFKIAHKRAEQEGEDGKR